MPLLAVALILVSCIMHAYWNFLFKKAHDKQAFTGLFLVSATALYFPMFIALRGKLAFPPIGWACVLGTAVVYFAYFQGLAWAYSSGDLSVVYPVARSVGPALTLAWGALFLGERLTPAGIAGVALILGGMLLLQRRPNEPRRSGRQLLASVGPAAFVGLTYSLYSLIDKIGVGRVRIDPVLYVYLTFSTSTLLVVPWMVRRRGLAPFQKEWRANRLPCVAVGVLNILAYLLILVAMSLPRAPLTYIMALRTLSVLFGAWLGIGSLGEEKHASKAGGVVAMISGVALIAWKG